MLLYTINHIVNSTTLYDAMSLCKNNRRTAVFVNRSLLTSHFTLIRQQVKNKKNNSITINVLRLLNRTTSVKIWQRYFAKRDNIDFEYRFFVTKKIQFRILRYAVLMFPKIIFPSREIKFVQLLLWNLNESIPTRKTIIIS